MHYLKFPNNQKKMSDRASFFGCVIKQKTVDACTNGSELVCDVDAGLLVNRVLDAAAVACREKRTVKI